MPRGTEVGLVEVCRAGFRRSPDDRPAPL